MDHKTKTQAERARTIINALNTKALDAYDGAEALRFSQAAVNVANSYVSLATLDGHS